MPNSNSKTRKWRHLSPNTHERTIMLKQCGKKCFLGPKKSFPICSKNTCTRNKKGVQAAYIRAREYLSRTGKRKYRTISVKARKLLKRM